MGGQCPLQGHAGKMRMEAGKRLSPDYKSLVYRDSDVSLLNLPAPSFLTGQDGCMGCFDWQGACKLLTEELLKQRCKLSRSLVPRTGPDIL